MAFDRAMITARVGARKAREVYAVEGARGVVRRTRKWVRQRRAGHVGSMLPVGPLPEHPVWHTSVLSVAERSLPQCYHYRVEQKREICGHLGIPFDDIDLQDVREALSRLQLASLLIVYRLPESPDLQRILAEAQRLRIPVVYEVDDLVYRQEATAANPNLATLPSDLRAAVIRGSAGYGRAVAAAENNLASTGPLAGDMASLNGGSAFVVENGIDATMLEIIEGLAVEPRAPLQPDGVVVTYGSGSRAHDQDFLLAAPALARWLAQTPHGSLKVIGPVRIPEVLEPFEDRIERITATLAYGEYLRELHASTITIAPLTDDHFNAFKSQVKYLEAALVEVPLIASPMVYSNYVDDGRTGLIARTTDDWLAALTRLTEDAHLRSSVAAAAREHVKQWELPNRPSEQFAALVDALTPAGVRR